MDRGKTVMNKSVVKPSDKTVVVQSYLEHEITLITSTIDAKITMHNLMKDRGILNERLINLQSTVNKTEQLEEEIKQLEEDLEMRNVQIGDLRAKVIQTDLESKIKQIPENFTSIPELRIAMAYILRAIVSGREDFTNVKMKAEDLRHNYEQSEERIEILSEQVEKMEQEHEFEKNKMERDFETKLTYLCMKEAKNKEGNEELALSLPKSQQFAWMTSHFAQKCDEIEDLKSQITDLKEEVEAFRAPKTNKSKKRGQDTFTVDEIENDLSSDSDDDFNFNDSFHDPEWRKTPAEKRSKTRATTHALLKESVVNRVNATGILANISETSDTNNSKRSLNGQPKCSCKGSCATKLCGCKKNGNFCMDTCKCSDACMNLPDESKESDGAGGSGEAVEKENEDESEVGDSPKRAK